jgi:drug/metabolite transporter (DMT)-like permease
MTTSKVEPTSTGEKLNSWQWLTVALVAQMGWGAYPVLLRYLQTVSGIPSLSLLAMGNLVVLIMVGTAVGRRIDKSLFRLPIVWLFGLMVVLRGITNLLATRYTLATYAQLIYLMTPFVVALLSRVVLHEALPRNTYKALFLALLGALLIMSGDWNATAVTGSIGRNDLLGMGMAIASSLFLALYMIITRRTATHNTSGEGLLLVHLISLFTFSAAVSLLVGESWSAWRTLSPTDWLVFGLLSLGVLLGANLGQIRSIQRLGAPVVSSMMAVRLVSALLFAGLLLGERLTSWWQLLGALVVMATITWYLRQQ